MSFAAGGLEPAGRRRRGWSPEPINQRGIDPMAEILKLTAPKPPRKGGFCLTPTVLDILDVLRITQEESELSVIVGGPGVGKTTAITYHAVNSETAWVITVHESARDLFPCMAQLAKVIGALNPNTGTRPLREEIANRLGFVGPKVLLVFDEAHKLEDATLEEIRSLYDQFEIGVVLVGDRSLLSRWGSKSPDRRSTWAQLVSRVAHMMDIPSPLPEDVDALCDHLGPVTTQARKLLTREVEARGDLRTVSGLIKIARKQAGNGAIGASHIETAMQLRGARP